MNSEQINVILNDCFAKLEQISQKEKKQLTIQSYQNLKKIQKKARKLTTTWLKEDDEKAQIEARIDNLQQLLSETEKTFPEQIRIRANWLDKNKKRKIVPFCHHDQVYWPRDKGEHPCCLDCGDNKSRSFLHNLQFNYHRINIKDWLGYRGLDTRELKETRYQFGKLSKAEYTNVEQVQEAYLEIEEELSQIANEKNLDRSGIVADGDRCKDRKTKQLREREREREREQICPQCNQSLTNQKVIWYNETVNNGKEFCSEICCNTYYEQQPVELDNDDNSLLAQDIRELRQKIQKLEANPRPDNPEWQNYLDFHKKRLTELENELKQISSSSAHNNYSNPNKPRNKPSTNSSNPSPVKNKSSSNSANNSNQGINFQLNQFFSQAKQQIIQIYGENSKEYQELLEQEKLLSHTSPEEQQQFLNLARELSPLQSKITFNPETKTMDLSKLNAKEQVKYARITQEISELLTKLKQEQAKQEQKSNNLKLVLWIGGSFILGAGLVGLIVWLVMRKRKV